MRKYPYAIFEIRVFNDLLVKRGFSHNYSYFTQHHLDYLKTLLHYGQSHYTKIRKMAQSMFKKVFNDLDPCFVY